MSRPSQITILTTLRELKPFLPIYDIAMLKGLVKDLPAVLQRRAKRSTRARSPVGTDQQVFSGDLQVSSDGSALPQRASESVLPAILPETTALRGGEFVPLDQESSPAGPHVLPSQQVTSGNLTVPSPGSSQSQKAGSLPGISPQASAQLDGDSDCPDREPYAFGTQAVALLGPQIASGIQPTRSSLSQKASGFSTIVPTPNTQYSENKPGLRVAVETGWKAFKLAIVILKEASVVFPPLQAAVGVLAKALEVIDARLITSSTKLLLTVGV